ncbi:hypothetical protein [Erythrobacter sp. F6033]|uniref:hypothetical protein n=1 Tax=Erythrobacter sp. F6033 TaxID=2926401 RepID=UPI001FF4597D|nr:hypothetical protein [Erythrobacter sp. F6033]MCK0128136.1 hypothetical protein [Erythrobacter sp. F6033]
MMGTAASADAPESAAEPERSVQLAEEELQHFIFVGGDDLANHEALFTRADISGAQVVYTWRGLEPREGEYNFDKVERDLKLANRLGKRLFIQLQDRFFLPESRYLPDYLLNEPKYGGGLVRQEDNAGEGKEKGSGWVAVQWNPHLRKRYQALLAALGERFDGRIYGINLPETAIEVPTDEDAPEGFTCDIYFDAQMENIASARAAFERSLVVQYVNFWPCEWNNDRQYMSRLFELGKNKGIGMGGPDIIPYRRGQIKNAYPFFEKVGDELPVVAMAVQAPTLTYTNPKTGKKFTRAEFEGYAVSKLNVDIIFWSLKTPWLKED